jgi:lysozyme
LNKKNIIYFIGAILLLILPNMAKASASGYTAIASILKTFIPSWELFSSHPYWDVSRYSWGYGTKAPGATGTITRTQAMTDLLTHVESDFKYLYNLIKRPLSANQWAAYLSFSYNLGPGNADNLVDNINSGNDVALEQQWKKYIYADGKISSNLIARRDAEWQLWQS